MFRWSYRFHCSSIMIICDSGPLCTGNLVEMMHQILQKWSLWTGGVAFYSRNMLHTSGVNPYCIQAHMQT